MPNIKNALFKDNSDKNVLVNYLLRFLISFSAQALTIFRGLLLDIVQLCLNLILRNKTSTVYCTNKDIELFLSFLWLTWNKTTSYLKISVSNVHTCLKDGYHMCGASPEITGNVFITILKNQNGCFVDLSKTTIYIASAPLPI